MALKLKVRDHIRGQKVEVASAVVIEAGDLVDIDAASGLLIKAVAASTAVACAITASPAGSIECDITKGRVELVGSADANFAKTDRAKTVDITDAQLIDLGTSTTNVLQVSPAVLDGTVGSPDGITVTINKPISF